MAEISLDDLMEGLGVGLSPKKPSSAYGSEETTASDGAIATDDVASSDEPATSDETAPSGESPSDEAVSDEPATSDDVAPSDEAESYEEATSDETAAFDETGVPDDVGASKEAAGSDGMAIPGESTIPDEPVALNDPPVSEDAGKPDEASPTEDTGKPDEASRAEDAAASDGMSATEEPAASEDAKAPDELANEAVPTASANSPESDPGQSVDYPGSTISSDKRENGGIGGIGFEKTMILVIVVFLILVGAIFAMIFYADNGGAPATGGYSAPIISNSGAEGQSNAQDNASPSQDNASSIQDGASSAQTAQSDSVLQTSHRYAYVLEGPLGDYLNVTETAYFDTTGAISTVTMTVDASNDQEAQILGFLEGQFGDRIVESAAGDGVVIVKLDASSLMMDASAYEKAMSADVIDFRVLG